MNQMHMPGFNPGNPGLGHMPMANNLPNGAGNRMMDDHVEEANCEGRLNTVIYGYFCSKGKYECARALKNSGMPFDPPLENSDINGADDSMQTDSKEGIDLKQPDDLPKVPSMAQDGQGGSFLLSWYSLFWDILSAQRKNTQGSKNAVTYVQHNQQQARIRHEAQQRMLQGPMMSGSMDPMQMMRFQNGMPNENLRQRAMANNNRGGMQPTPQQVAAMRTQQMMQHQQQGMRRDPSEMDMNGGQRPRTPSGGDHAPSPSKRQRMDGTPFNQMMPNGRVPPPGMPGQMMGGDSAMVANNMLVTNGINPGNLSDTQFASFQSQKPAVQQRSIQVYAQNLAKNQRQQSMLQAGGSMIDQGSPLMASGMELGVGGPDFYGGANPTAMQMRGNGPPNVPNVGTGNHALQDYQMQLMLLEQQNKKRLLMARQEQDNTIGGRGDGQPGMPGGPGFGQGMSPVGSRGGPSPGPGDGVKRGTPKMNAVGLPASPLPDGSLRGSPAAMNFAQMNPEMYAQMNGTGAMRPPNNGHQFNPQFTPQMDAMARPQGGRQMPNGSWAQAPQGQPPMPIQQPQPPQATQIGTPQQRNAMPPPPAGPVANGRTSPAAPPTPQPANKGKPKGKKDPAERKRPKKQGSTASVTATPAAETENDPPAPTTPQNANSFSAKNEGQPQAGMVPGMNPPAPELAPPQADANTLAFEMNGTDYGMPYDPDLNGGDLLEHFDFEQFLQGTDGGEFSFDQAAFEDGIEAGMGGT